VVGAAVQTTCPTYPLSARAADSPATSARTELDLAPRSQRAGQDVTYTPFR
jgi:hypothetical protein